MGSKLRKKLGLFIVKIRANGFMRDRRGAVTAQRVMGYGIAFFLIGILFPIGMNSIMNATVTGWDSAVQTVFQTLLPILCVIGIAIDFLPRRKKGD